MALDLTVLAGVATVHGKTRLAEAPNIYNVVIEYKGEHVTRYLLRTAVELVEALVKGEPFPLEERIKEAKAIAADTELGPSTRSIVDAAARRGIPWRRIGEDSFVQLGYGKNRRFIQAAMCEHTSAISVEAAGDKEFTKLLLRQVSIPVPRGEVVRTEEDAIDALDRIGVPGDRDDSVIEQAGRAAARGFHRIIIREDHDLRGRRKGEVAELLCRAVQAEAPATECLIVFDEVDALSRELEQMRDGQVVLIFYDKLGPVLEVLEGHGAQPASSIELEESGAIGTYAITAGGVRSLS